MSKDWQEKYSLDHFFNLSLDLLCISDMDGYFKKLNPVWEKVLGFSIDELCSKSYLDFIHPDDIEPTLKEIEKQAKGDSVLSFENRYRTKDGNYRWLSWKSVPVGAAMYAVARDVTDQKDTECDRDENFKAIADHISQFTWIADRAGNIFWYNQRWYQYLGTQPERMAGSAWKEFVHPEDLGRVLEQTESALAEEQEFEVEYRLKRASDGQYRWFLRRVVPLRNSAGAVTKWLGTCTDIHDRKEEAMRLLDLKLRTDLVVNNVGAVIWAIDRHGVITFYHGREIGNFGIQTKDRVGMNIFELNRDRPEVQAAIRECLTGKNVTFEGMKFGAWFRNHVTPVLGSDGQVEGAVGVALDITENKSLETALRKNEDKFRRIFESPLCGMLFWNSHGAIADANDTFLKLVGYTRDDLKRGLVNWREMTPSEYAPLDENCLLELSERGYCEPFEKEYIRKDGTRVPILLGGAVLPAETGMAGIAFILDLTDKKEKERLAVRERSAIEASKLKSEFLANTSHEIRTPINGIVGMAGLLLDTALTQEQREYVESIRISGDVLLTVINDILDFSKVEAGKLDLEVVEFNLCDLIRETKKTMMFNAQQKGLPLLLSELPKLSHLVKADPGRLRQVLNNLLSNAIKFTEKGCVTLTAEVREGVGHAKSWLRVEVKDTGIGIGEDASSRLFKAFSQADASTSRRYGGTGLGLSISKRLVELMGGAIGVESVAGVGSTFWFTIPLEKGAPIADPPRIPAERAVGPDLPLPFARVLVAEDNPINQRIAIKQLECLGLHADGVGNGMEVLDALKNVSYDLILMDCQMPELDGFGTTRLIRSGNRPGFNGIPIIAMTANALSGDRKTCLDAGMDDYVSKPVKVETLRDVLSKWLNK